MRLRTAGEGPLVLKIAGMVSGVDLYAEEMELARAAGFRVAALDTTGDRRDDPAPGPLSWDLLSGEVARSLDRLDAEDAVLWGTSYGCIIALTAAARYPDRVSGLLLSFPPDPAWQPRLFRAIHRWARRQSVATNAKTIHRCFLALTGWEFVFPTALARLPALARASIDASTPARTIVDKVGMMWDDPPDLDGAGASIPTSIIAAALDTVAPLSGARRLKTRLPDARLRVIRIAGHSAAYSRPRTYHRWAIEELRRLTGQ